MIFTYDKITEKDARLSIGDIMHTRNGSIDNNQFLSISRLLDIEDFVNNGDSSFKRQNTISYAAYGEKHKRNGRENNGFIKLIESYKKNGYDLHFPYKCSCYFANFLLLHQK